MECFLEAEEPFLKPFRQRLTSGWGLDAVFLETHSLLGWPPIDPKWPLTLEGPVMFWGSQVFPLLTTPFRTLTKGPQASHPPLTVHPVLCTKSSTESHMLPNALLCCWVLSSSISSPGPDGGGSRLVFGLLGFSQAFGVGDGAWCTCFRQISQPLIIHFSPLARSLWRQRRPEDSAGRLLPSP